MVLCVEYKCESICCQDQIENPRPIERCIQEEPIAQRNIGRDQRERSVKLRTQ